MTETNFFSDQQINSGRQKELDWARGLAVVFMVFKHTKEYLPGFDLSSAYSRVICFLGAAPAGPTFMILLGAGIVFSRNKSPKKLALRGASLIALNYALNFAAFGMPELILFAQTGDVAFWKDCVLYTLGVDILAFAGLALLFFALAEKLRLPPVDVALVALILSCLNYLTPRVDNFPLGAAAGLFADVNDNSYFPLLSWIGYPVMGYIFGRFLIRCTDKRLFYKYIFAFSAFSVAAFSLGSRKHGFSGVWSLFFGADEYFSQDFIQYFLVGGICFLWISILFSLSEIGALDFAGKHLSRWSRNVTPMFVAHWVIVGWLELSPVNFPENPYVNFITGVAIVMLSDAAAVLYRLREVRGKS